MRDIINETNEKPFFLYKKMLKKNETKSLFFNEMCLKRREEGSLFDYKVSRNNKISLIFYLHTHKVLVC